MRAPSTSRSRPREARPTGEARRRGGRPGSGRLPGPTPRRLAVALALAAALGLGAPGPGPRLARAEAPIFSGENALALARRQCAFGPRSPVPPGAVAGGGGRTGAPTKAAPVATPHDRCRDFLLAELTRLAGAARRQDFTYTLPKDSPVGGGATLRLTNILASFAPEKPRRVLLCAHWDTRPWADQEKDAARRLQAIPGANDGASGVAVLLEMARLLRDHPAAYGVDIVLFDGEDLGTEAHPEAFFRGSSEYALRLGSARPDYALLLDMVGDADLQFKKEGYSWQMAPKTTEWLWTAGRELSPDHFLDQVGYFILDDHIPLLKAGVPCADLIDFDYPAWHTHADTPDRLSATSFQVVGDVLVRLLYPDAADRP